MTLEGYRFGQYEKIPSSCLNRRRRGLCISSVEYITGGLLEELSFGERTTIGTAQNFDVSSTLTPIEME